MYLVYILQSLRSKRTYVGFTKNLKDRMSRHSTGQVSATKNLLPLRLLYTEGAADIENAKRRERYWKSGAGRRIMKSWFVNS
jgi:putative endonuclease